MVPPCETEGYDGDGMGMGIMGWWQCGGDKMGSVQFSRSSVDEEDMGMGPVRGRDRPRRVG